jgi:hypothetical protein
MWTRSAEHCRGSGTSNADISHEFALEFAEVSSIPQEGKMWWRSSSQLVKARRSRSVRLTRVEAMEQRSMASQNSKPAKDSSGHVMDRRLQTKKRIRGIACRTAPEKFGRTAVFWVTSDIGGTVVAFSTYWTAPDY